MGERRGSKLAERMKAKLDEEEAARARAIAERERALSKARAARDELFDDLEAFAAVVGHLACARQGENLVIRKGERFIECAPMGEGDRVRLTFTGSEGHEHRLYREAALEHRWVWSFTRPHRGEERLPLFDSGLEELLVLALELPRITPADPDPITAPPKPSRVPAAAPAPDPFAAFSEPTSPDTASDIPPARGPAKRNL
ncbi:MAG: hypothetical protein KC912_03355 [Proteobacteria bacterium]|nr:hypothetical protein [Pseudomonadota bacterium]